MRVGQDDTGAHLYEPVGEVQAALEHPLVQEQGASGLLNRTVVVRLLEKLGHRVTQAHNGRQALDAIEAERARKPFASLADFTARTAPNRRELDALSYSGSFSCFGLSRREALWQAAAVERDPASLLAGAAPSAELHEVVAKIKAEATPFWDQWTELNQIYRPYLTGELSLSDEGRQTLAWIEALGEE